MKDGVRPDFPEPNMPSSTRLHSGLLSAELLVFTFPNIDMTSSSNKRCFRESSLTWHANRMWWITFDRFLLQTDVQKCGKAFSAEESELVMLQCIAEQRCGHCVMELLPGEKRKTASHATDALTLSILGKRLQTEPVRPELKHPVSWKSGRAHIQLDVCLFSLIKGYGLTND